VVGEKFVPGLASGQMLSGLRIKRYESIPAAWEMTWADDGRALFFYGEERRKGHVHIVWIMVGDHSIL
jgi:hypothetical protein